jgi:gliding motility-associated-like protein
MNTFTSPPKFLLLLIFFAMAGLITAQKQSHVLGTPCSDCPVPKFTPAIIMDGNQADVTSYTATACGLNYVYGSVKLGKRWSSPGVTQPAGITISGLPTGCNTILKAFLYGDASGNGIAVTATVVNPASVSTAYPMSIIGIAPDKCWSYSGSYSYRADITTCITGNGTYMVSGLPTNPPTPGNDFDGATILIIYADPSQTYTGHLTIGDGAHVAAPSVLITDNIAIPAACANSTYADGFIIVGDLQGISNTPMRFNSSVPNYTFPAASNLTWNVVQAAANPVTAGQTSAQFGATNSGDCYNIVACGLYYRTTCNTCTFSPGSMSITAASTSSCSTGTATANPIGGTGPFTYSWSPGSATTQTISGAPGVYTVTVKDAACSSITTTVAINALPPVSINLTTNQPSCLNPPGTSTAVVSGGNTASGFTVSWAPAPGTVTPTSNGSIASGLTVGTMTAFVIDASGCSANSTFTVSSPAIASFSLNASSGTTLTCLNPSVTLNAVNTSTLSNITYTWMPGNANGNSYNANAAGVYTVTGQDLTVGSCPVTQTISVSQNTTAPVFTISPILTQSIGCNQACKTFTAVASTTTNVFGTWYDVTAGYPGIPLVGPSGGTVVLCAGTPGIYAITFTNMVSGCPTTQTVSVTSNTSVPTITVTSVLGGFQLNCTKPCLPLNINSNVTVGPTSYTWTNLTTSISSSPANGGYTVCTTGANVPGQYVASVKDGLGCTVSTTITISIDTLRPAPTSTATLASLAPDSYTINCFTPSIVATGISNPLYPASNYSWTIPPNLIQSNQTLTVSMVNITSSTSPTNYTVLAMNPANGCVGRKLVKFYKDVFVPPYTVVFTPSAITCADSCVAFSPKNSVTSNTMPVTYTFTSPPPTQTATTLGALMCVPGPYTMTYMNATNGCTAATTTTVTLNTTPPATFALTNATINCGATTTTLIAGHTGSATASTYSYNWSGPPLAGMSCPGGMNCYSTTANAPGLYQVTILNTVNGCVATNSLFVVPGILDVSYTSDFYTGFAPLTVNFNNTTPLGSLSTGTVTTTWSYGNGITQTFTGTSTSYSATGPPNGSTVYQSAGSYTVLLIMSQTTGMPPGPGMPPNACVSTYTAIVEVELPSEMIIPNVFTPNGDGVNDVFAFRTTSMTEITCMIFDRWGVKMYDVNSDKGNIAWDGKNLFNKDVPDGTYFYIIKGKGKDLKDYEFKGTVSLYR